MHHQYVDIYSLYKSVTAMGGFPRNNPRALNWGGKKGRSVFSQMRNWTEDNRATSAGKVSWLNAALHDRGAWGQNGTQLAPVHASCTVYRL